MRGDDHRCGLAGTDTMREQSARVERGQDPPHRILLVRARCEVRGDTGEGQVGAVVGDGLIPVVQPVVPVGQSTGAFTISPTPLLQRFVQVVTHELFLRGGFRVRAFHLPVPDLNGHHHCGGCRVARSHHLLQQVVPTGAILRRPGWSPPGCRPLPGRRVIHHLRAAVLGERPHELGDILRGQPGHPQLRHNLRLRQRCREHRLQRGHVTLPPWIGHRVGERSVEFADHIARQVSGSQLPLPRFQFERHRTQVSFGFHPVDTQLAGDVLDVEAVMTGQRVRHRAGQRIRRIRPHRAGVDHWALQDRRRATSHRFLVEILDRRDTPPRRISTELARRRVDALHVRHFLTNHVIVGVFVFAGLADLQLEPVERTETVGVLVVQGSEFTAGLLVGFREVVEHPVSQLTQRGQFSAPVLRARVRGPVTGEAGGRGRIDHDRPCRQPATRRGHHHRCHLLRC